MNALPPLTEHIEHFRKRVVQDALTEAMADYWNRRAAVMEWARPRPDEFHGEATTEQLREQWYRLTATAEACRQRATVSLIGGTA